MDTKMEPSYANLFVGFIEHPFFSQNNGPKPELYGRYINDCIGATSSTREELTQFITAVNSFHPALKYTWGISDTSLAFLDIKISIEGNGLCTSVYYKPTDSHSYLLYSSSHPSHVKNSISFSQFSDFIVYAVTTLIFQKNQRQCASFSINVAIQFLSFKWATRYRAQQWLTVSSHYKRLRREILIAFHSLSHFTLTTTLLNTSFSKTLKYFKTIQRLVLSFCNLHQFNSNVTKTQATFWTKVHFKPITNLELSNALAQCAKLVLSFIT